MTCTEYSLESRWFGIAGQRRDEYGAGCPGTFLKSGIDVTLLFVGPLVITPFPGSPRLVNKPTQLGI